MSARGRNEQPAAFQGKQNIFSVLCLDSDSDSEGEKEKEVSLPVVEEVSVTVSKEVVEDTPVTQPQAAPPSPPFRVWSDTPSRFKNDHIFSSPFSRKKTHWSRPRFKEDSEGWTSIQVPASADAGEDAGAGEDKAPTDFPSLLTRSSGGDANASDDHQSALAWAEKVKRSLERAENGRYESKQFSETSISFFRKL